MSIFVVLPTQLFKVNLKDFKNVDEIYIVEHPYYFTRLSFHKLKLGFLVSSMKNYQETLKKLKIKVVYITYDKYNSWKNEIKSKNIIIYDPIDLEVLNEFQKLKAIVLDNPGFLIKTIDLESITYKRHEAFYNFSKCYIKEKYSINYTSLKNMDKLNRKSMSEKQISEFKEKKSIYPNKFHNYAIKYINTNFAKNFGELDMHNLSELPKTHKDAEKHLDYFLKKLFNNFGPYQDFISKKHERLYHSNISFLINIGLLTPIQILKKIEKYRTMVNIQSFEGFIRQLIGWREYMRYIYIRYPDIESENFWKNKKKLNWAQFYGEKSTKFDIIDNEITKLKRTGWCHHITRLAVFLNYFVLAEINPVDVKKWFLEVIALDAYEWVMVSNIWTMGYYTKRFTSKPYYLSSNYLNKMSNYVIEPEWDVMYRKFVNSKKDFKYWRY